MTALIALVAASPLATKAATADDLLDLADGLDPDDEALFSELTRVREQLPELSLLAHRLIDADYHAAAAFERLMRARHRLGLKAESRAALTAPALQLLARVCDELMSKTAGVAAPVVVDATRGSGDALVALTDRLEDDLVVSLPRVDRPSVRLARRRLLARGVSVTSFAVQATGEFRVEGPAVHIAHLPSSDMLSATVADVLTSIEQIVRQADDSHSGVIMGPSAALVDSLADPKLDSVRSAMLRGGRVRAIIQLPTGLLATRPREATALWVLGAAYARVPLAERWTLMADLSSTTLTDAVITDLTSDVAAALGTAFEVRAHAFAFARPVFTSRLLAQGGALRAEVGARPRRSAANPDAAAALIGELGLDWSLEPVVNDTAQPTTVAKAIESGALQYLPGTRLGETELGGSGAKVVGVAELTGSTEDRRVDLLEFAAAHPNARLTEPGDIVFCTSPRVSAMVDEHGSAVVEFPARVLRINRESSGGLVAEVVTHDIRAAPALGSWRRWPLRTVPEGQATALAQALGQLNEQRKAAQARLAELDRATQLITSAVTAGAATLRPTTTKGP